MKSDTVIRVEAMHILIEKLGEVDAERFLQMVKKDDFDYTRWREKLWDGISVDELHQQAAEYERIRK